MIDPEVRDGARLGASAYSPSLERVVRTINVWSDCRYPLLRAEGAVIATPPFQRLRRLRQMGLAFHAWANAENTRASHSLGVAYWSSQYLEALRRVPDATTQAGLAWADAAVEGLSFGVVLRLYALLHDIDLLPLGHTLRYQSGLFGEPQGRPRLRASIAAIKAHAGHTFDQGATVAELTAFERHLDAAGDALAGEDDSRCRVPVEIVNSGLGADLFDFALRDSFAIGRPQAVHGELLGALRLVEIEGGFGLALDVGDVTDYATAARRVAMADDLYRARFEIFAASVFHPVKLAADAMLDFALRRLGAEARADLLPEACLLSLGDDEFLDRVAGAEGAAARRIGAESIAAALQAGRLHEEVWRTEDLAAFRGRADAPRALALSPEWRNEAEAALLARLPWAASGDLIVAVSPPTMQAKPANARFVGPGGEVFTLAEASAHGFATKVDETTARYDRLWSLRVYLAPRVRSQPGAVAAAAAATFGVEG